PQAASMLCARAAHREISSAADQAIDFKAFYTACFVIGLLRSSRCAA
ncbi:MAG: hypothetical protein ACI83N_001627, partial [Hydrogenophaga sp.]